MLESCQTPVMPSLTHGSLFSGIGGFDLAAERIGFKNIFHCEWIENKRQILKQHFPKTLSYADIREFDGRKYNGTIDVISGGFPCQDISIANQSSKTKGAQGIKGERSGLWKEYARIIREIEPGIIIFENSPMLLNRGFEVVLCDLSELGYNVEWRLFYATQFGFPHKRERIYGVAYSKRKRWKNIVENGGILHKILPERTSRQKPVSIPIKRFNSKSSYADVRMDDGFPYELDKDRIHGLGNAIIPEIAFQIFKAIALHDASLSEA
jgi:DNA (cytosine-5)-methyltransferase 1